ncbi:MAG: hypothetical protein V1835_01535 [Candidatus Micrarchaeota archaeon]
MELQVLTDKENKLHSRREIVVKMAVEKATLSRKEVMKAVQSHFAAAEDTIVIDKIEHSFGSKHLKVHFKIYENSDGAKREPAYKAKRGKEGNKKEGEAA